MDLDTLLQKHGLPTWGSEEVKKERAQRNNLLAADKHPVAPTMEKRLIPPLATKEQIEAVINARDDADMVMPVEFVTLAEAKKMWPESPKRGRPAKVK